jgi:hypothetical protein
VVPSITTILKAEAKPALQQWVADQTAAYAVANLDKLYQSTPEKGWGFLRYFWNRNPGDPLSKSTDLTDYHKGVLSDAADLGTAVHEWMQADATGISPFPDVTNLNEKFWECVGAWNTFRSEHTIKPHWTEHTVWSDEIPGLEYAGTFDCFWEIDGELCLIDIKTSRGLYSSTWMQLAALYKAPILLADGPAGVDLQIRNWQTAVEKVKVIHIRPTDQDHRGNHMPAFCKMVDVPGDLDSHFKSFMGLRQYLQGQRELTLVENALAKEAKASQTSEQ